MDTRSTRDCCFGTKWCYALISRSCIRSVTRKLYPASPARLHTCQKRRISVYLEEVLTTNTVSAVVQLPGGYLPNIRKSPPPPPHRPVSPPSQQTDTASIHTPLRTTRRTSRLGGSTLNVRAEPPLHGPMTCFVPSSQYSLKPSKANPACICE